MIRPVEQHERLHPKEYVDRVRKAEGSPEAEARDFSYLVREVDHHKQQQQSDSDFGEDTYEASDNPPSEQPADSGNQSRDDRADPDRPREDGSLDLTA
jgi:hypothetical protein